MSTYRLIDGHVCRQDVTGGEWVVLSKTDANALLDQQNAIFTALGATDQTEALERIMILQGVATGQLAKRYYAVQSISGTHIGMWQSREDAIAVMREYYGSSLIKLYEVPHG